MRTFKLQHVYGLTEYASISILLMMVVIASFQGLAKPVQQQVATSTAEIGGYTPLEETLTQAASPSLMAKALEFGQGFIAGLESQVDNLSYVIRHPIETLKALKSLSESLVQDPIGTLKALGADLLEDAQALVSGTLWDQGKVAGENVSPAAMATKAAGIAKAILVAKRATDKPNFSIKEKPDLVPDADVPESLLENRALYENGMPENLKDEILLAQKIGVEPQRMSDYLQSPHPDALPLKFVVTEKGELIVAPTVYIGDKTISHAVLSGGRPVYAAGEVEIGVFNDYRYGLKLSNHTGHYKVPSESLDIAQTAFQRYGFDFSNALEFYDNTKGY